MDHRTYIPTKDNQTYALSNSFRSLL
jgi:adenylyl cyclase-associated protein